MDAWQPIRKQKKPRQLLKLQGISPLRACLGFLLRNSIYHLKKLKIN